MVLGPALFRADLPQGVVLVDDRGHKVVRLIASLNREWLSVGVVQAAVGVMSNRMPLGPRPDVPVGISTSKLKLKCKLVTGFWE